MSDIQKLVDDTRARLHLEDDYWKDQRLKELCLALERLMPFGYIQVENPQPAAMWALVYRENGKRKVAISFDGPPSDAYLKLVPEGKLVPK